MLDPQVSSGPPDRARTDRRQDYSRSFGQHWTAHRSSVSDTKPRRQRIITELCFTSFSLCASVAHAASMTFSAVCCAVPSEAAYLGKHYPWFLADLLVCWVESV